MVEKREGPLQLYAYFVRVAASLVDNGHTFSHPTYRTLADIPCPHLRQGQEGKVRTYNMAASSASLDIVCRTEGDM